MLHEFAVDNLVQLDEALSISCRSPRDLLRDRHRHPRWARHRLARTYRDLPVDDLVEHLAV